MDSDQTQNLETVLKALGFVQGGNPLIWIWSEKEKISLYSDIDSELADETPKCPFRITRWEIKIDLESIIESKISVELDAEHVRKRISESSGKQFTQKSSVYSIETKPGLFWFLFEFNHSDHSDLLIDQVGQLKCDSKQLIGLSGFRMQMRGGTGVARVMLSEYFSLGAIPKEFAGAPIQLVQKGLGIDDHMIHASGSVPSLYELTFSLEQVALSVIKGGLPLEHRKYVLYMEKFLEGTVSDSITYDVIYEKPIYIMSNLCENFAKSFAQAPKVPLEVLETLESENKLRTIDLAILSGDLSSAKEQCEELIRNEGPAVYVLRRLAYLSILDEKTAFADEIEGSKERENNNKLFLSSSIQNALQTERYPDTLAYISELGESLISDGIDIDAHPAFDVVLPELLGDSWAHENPEKAVDCYSSIIEKRGDIPRVLQKIIGILRENNLKEEEVRYLTKLASIESRSEQLAKIYLREAELHGEIEGERQNGIEKSLEAIQKDRSLYQAAELAARLLCEDSRPEDAIHLLRDLLKTGESSFTPFARARLEFQVGSIWESHFGRTDLALICFENASKLDPGWPELLDRLEDAYRESGNASKLGPILVRNVEALMTEGDWDRSWISLCELIDNFGDAAIEKPKKLALIKRFAESSTIDAGKFEKLKKWDLGPTEWLPILSSVEERIPDLIDAEERCRIRVLLAAQFRSLDRHKAIALLQEASFEGQIEQIDLFQLVDDLIQKGENRESVEVLRSQLRFYGDDSRQFLLKKLISIDSGLDDHDFFEFALQLYQFDQSVDEEIENRLLLLAKKEDYEQIARVHGMFTEYGIGSIQQANWTYFFIDLMQPSSWEGRSEFLKNRYLALLESSEDEESILQKAIEQFNSEKDVNVAREFVEKALDLGILPRLLGEEIVAMLGELPDELARYYELSAEQAATDPDKSSEFARSALRILKVSSSDQARILRVLSKIGIRVPLEGDERELFMRTVETQNSWQEFVDVGKVQLTFMQKDEERREFKLALGKVYTSKLGDHESARIVYLSMIEEGDRSLKVCERLARVAEKQEDFKLLRKALLMHVSAEGSFDDFGKYSQSIRRLQSLKIPKEYVRTILEQQVMKAYSADSPGAVEKLASLLVELNLDSPDAWIYLFAGNLERQSFEDSLGIWVSGLKKLASTEAIQGYLDRTGEILGSKHGDDIGTRCLLTSVKDRSIPVPDEVRSELSVIYAYGILDQHDQGVEALRTLAGHHNDNMRDTRIWIILYFLLIEYGSNDDRRVFLERILPKIKRRDFLIEKYQITVDELEDDLRDLRLVSGDPNAEPIVPRFSQEIGIQRVIDVARSDLYRQRANDGDRFASENQTAVMDVEGMVDDLESTQVSFGDSTQITELSEQDGEVIKELEDDSILDWRAEVEQTGQSQGAWEFLTSRMSPVVSSNAGSDGDTAPDLFEKSEDAPKMDLKFEGDLEESALVMPSMQMDLANEPVPMSLDFDAGEEEPRVPDVPSSESDIPSPPALEPTELPFAIPELPDSQAPDEPEVPGFPPKFALDQEGEDDDPELPPTPPLKGSA